MMHIIYPPPQYLNRVRATVKVRIKISRIEIRVNVRIRIRIRIQVRIIDRASATAEVRLGHARSPASK